MTRHTKLRAANEARSSEWTGMDKVSLSFWGNSLAGETGEACNIIKKLERMRLGYRGSTTTENALAEELADVVILADLIAMEIGVDLDRAVRDKFNATSRKYGLSTKLLEEV